MIVKKSCVFKDSVEIDDRKRLYRTLEIHVAATRACPQIDLNAPRLYLSEAVGSLRKSTGRSINAGVVTRAPCTAAITKIISQQIISNRSLQRPTKVDGRVQASSIRAFEISNVSHIYGDIYQICLKKFWFFIFYKVNCVKVVKVKVYYRYI